jgi:predicted Zn-dependent peptidase
MFQRLVVILALFLLNTSSFAFTRINAPNPDDPMDVHIYQLENGLTIYLTDNHEEPQFHAEIVVRAGSKNDPKETTGLAHYLEHLLFKGSQQIGTIDYVKEKPYLDQITELYEAHYKEKDPDKRKTIYAQINDISQKAAQYAIPNETDKLYKAMGETWFNAHTWYEETVYNVTLPSNRLEQWATIESDRFQSPVFRLFQSELEIVYEEKNQTLDDKDELVYDAIGKLLFKKHPYGQQTTIGEAEHLKNPSLKNIYEFYDTYYVPNNMAICISGDIDIDETIQTLDQSFSIWQKKALPKPKIYKEKDLKNIERDTVRFQGEEKVQIGFRTAPNNHKDTEALILIDMLLDNATAGLINLNLVQKQTVRDAGSEPLFLNEYGVQYLWGIPKEGQTLSDVEQLLLSQIGIIQRGEFDANLLSAIVTDFKKSQKRALESNRSRVTQLREAFISETEWDEAVAKIQRLEKITKTDIIRVANQYFGQGYAVVYRIDAQHELPKIEKPDLAKVELDPTRQSILAQKILSIPTVSIAPVYITDKDYQIVDVQNGLKLYHTQNPINDLFTLTISVDIGTYQNNKLGMAKALMDKSGAGDLTSETLKKTWYALGTDFTIGVEDNQTNITLSGLDENLEPSLILLHRYLTTPTATQETLQELINITHAEREDEKKNPRSIRNALRQYSRYGDNSAYKRQISTDALNKLTVSELHTLIGSLLTYQHNILYVGTKSIDDVTALIKQHHTIPEALQETPPYEFLQVQTSAQNEIRIVHKEMAQSLIFIEFGDVPYDNSLKPSVDLYNDYFSGGMASIIFQELREIRALAYSTFARYELGDREGEQNLMWGYIGCQADKTPEAITAFVDLIDNLPETPERFEETQNAVLNQYRGNKLKFRDILPAIRTWENRGLSPDPRQARFEAIQKAGINTMLDFHKAHIQSRAKLISIVGDTTQIDMTQLVPVGTVMPVDAQELFVK